MRINPKYTFPFSLAMSLFAYHTLLTKWETNQSTAFWLSLAGFIGLLGLTVATFYKAALIR